MEVLKTKRGVIIIIGFVLAVICLTIGIILLFNQDSKVEEVKEQNNNTKDEIKVEDGKETDIDDNNSQKSETEDNDNNLKVDEEQTQEDNKTNDNNSNTSTNNNSNTSTNNNSNNSSNTQKTTTKNINVDEPIVYSTQEIQEVNLPRGQKQTSQAGKNGVKRITYKVTYNSNGTEISRTKVSESVISQPVNQIIKVGVSDFNLNTSKLENEVYSMDACTDSQFVIDNNGAYCVERKRFGGVIIDGTLYLTSYLTSNDQTVQGDIINIRPIIPLKLINNQFEVYNGNYNGTNYYFMLSFGTSPNRALTQNDCDKYGLACGRW